jgi:hypothetical protein
MPIDLQVGMQSTLHQNASAAQFHSFANFVVDGLEIQDVTLFSSGSFERPVEGAERAVLGAEICVIDITVDDVGDNARGMQFAAQSIRLHTDANQVIGLVKFEGLLFAQGHSLVTAACANFSGEAAVAPNETSSDLALRWFGLRLRRSRFFVGVLPMLEIKKETHNGSTKR